MLVVDFLKEEWILADIASTDKEGVLAEMVAAFGDVIKDKAAAVRVLLEREKLGSTGIGEGIAIPHGKLTGLDKVISVFARSQDGVDFDAMDGAPVHNFFLLMAPEDSASMHLKALARISRLLKSRQFRDELAECSSASELYRKISEEDEKY
ncbi:MAG: PTS fructose transporter subunit IIA [Deltaproteobacteria bacterium]|nr:MAG: PTS fructose transporter subunit IIA [Deltaproteobacteria bacterium]